MPPSPPFRVTLLLVAVAFVVPNVSAQTDRLPYLEGDPAPVGVRSSVTESWGAMRFTLVNHGSVDRTMRLQLFYPSEPAVRYGRDVWVPARARLTSWVAVGPAPEQQAGLRSTGLAHDLRPELSRDVQFILYHRDGDEWRQIPPKGGDERLGSRREPYLKREPTTVLLVDGVANDLRDGEPQLLPPDSSDSQSLLLARTFRQARGLSEQVNVISERFLPAVAEAFDGVDLLVLAGNRLEQDPVGLQAVRRWVEQGGTLWVMLDVVKAEVVAAVLGNDLRFQVVDRTGLTTVRITPFGEKPDRIEAREFDRPVELVRVILGDGDTPLFETDGWPAAFSRPVGRGRLVVTTLGGRAWHRPREARDRKSPFPNFPDQPVEGLPFERLSFELFTPTQATGFTPLELAPTLTSEIGYTVVGRRTAALILGGFVLTLIALGVGVRYSRRPEVIGWLAPAAAVVTATTFVALGISSRRAVPPTEGAVAILDVAPGSEEAAATGVYAVYRPTSGETLLTTAHGGTADLTGAVLESQVRHRMHTDLGAWRWENVTLPAGIQVGPVRTTVNTGPVAAVARFGPEGVTGTLTTGRYPNPADAVILTPAREPVGVRLNADGTFRVGTAGLLPAGQFLADTVLADKQQRRQEVYRRLLARPVAKHLENRDLLFAWTDAGESPVKFDGAERTVGSALLAIPLEFERPPPGTRVTIPRGFVPVSGTTKGRRAPPTLEAANATDIGLRFQLPPSVLPLEVEKATLHLTIRAPARKVAVFGMAGGGRVPLHEVTSPIDPIRVEIADPKLLTPDADGGLPLLLTVGDPVADGGKDKPATAFGQEGGWKIESLTMEVTGSVR